MLTPSKSQRQCVVLWNHYNSTSIFVCFPRLKITTESSQTSVPLTVACLAAVFASPESQPRPHFGFSPCVNPRIPDPCSKIRWLRWGCPKKTQMIEVIETLSIRACVRRVNTLPLMTVVELIHGDGRDYPRCTLPGIFAGVATTHHHGSLPLIEDMEYHNHKRLIDPAPYLWGHRMGPLSQGESRKLLETEELVMKNHFEVKEMGTGLVILTFHRSAMKQSKIPPGHPSYPTPKWQRYNLYQNLSPPGSKLLDGLRGAPTVSVHRGDLAGFMDIAAGDYAQGTAFNDLIAEAWVLV